MTKGPGTLVYVKIGTNYTRVLCLRAVSEMTLDTEIMDLTALDADTRSYGAGVKKLPECTLKCFLDQDDTGQQALFAAYGAAQERDFKIVFSDGGYMTFPALIKKLTLGGMEDDQMVQLDITLQLTEGAEFSWLS